MNHDFVSDNSSAIVEHWFFDNLCRDLSEYKGNELSKGEKQYLCYFLQGYSPKTINGVIRKNENSNSLRPNLSEGLYSWLKELVTERTGEEIDFKTCRCRCVFILEKLGYRKSLMGNSARNQSSTL